MRLPSLLPWLSACMVVMLVAATPISAQGPRLQRPGLSHAQALPAAFAKPTPSAPVRRSGSRWLTGALIGLGIGLVAGAVLADRAGSDEVCDTPGGIVCAAAAGATFIGVALLGLVVGTVIGASTSK